MRKKKAEPLPEVETPDTSELPEGWLLTSVGEQFQIVGGGTPSTKKPEYWEGDIPWISSADIYGIKKIVPRRNINENALKNSAANLVPKGSIIVVTRVSLGRLAICETPISFSQDCHALIPKTDSVDPEFALYYLSQAVQSFKKDSRGTTISGVTVNVVSSLPFLLPPLSEQQRIVARVEALLTQVNAARERLSRVPLIMKKFRQAVLAAACSGKLTEGWREANPDFENVADFIEKLKQEKRAIDKKRMRYLSNPDFSECHEIPETWGWVRLGEISIAVDVDHKMPKAVENGLPLISPKDFVEPDKIDFKNAKKISPEDFDRMCRKIRPEMGDILLSRYGTIGKVRKVPVEPQFQISYSLCLIRPFLDLKNNDYLYWILQSMPVYHQALANDKSSSIPDLGIKDINNFTIPLPPLAEQHEIVRRVGLLFERADAIDREVAAAGRRCERLTQAVLGKAFAGKL